MFIVFHTFSYTWNSNETVNLYENSVYLLLFFDTEVENFTTSVPNNVLETEYKPMKSQKNKRIKFVL